MFELALTRLVEIVGEAASRLPAGTRNSIPNIPWTKVLGMRNVLVHGYDKIHPKLLWNTVVEDLPVLAQEVEAALQKLESA